MVAPMVTDGASFTSVTVIITAAVKAGLIAGIRRLSDPHHDSVARIDLVVHPGPRTHRDLAGGRVYLETARHLVGRSVPYQAVGQNVVSGVVGLHRVAHIGPSRRVLGNVPGRRR